MAERTGARLIVGRDIEDIAQHEELLEAAVPWTLGVSVLLGVMGGIIMSFAIGRRIDAVSSTARTVISGDMSSRVPLRGGGRGIVPPCPIPFLSPAVYGYSDTFNRMKRPLSNERHPLRLPLPEPHPTRAWAHRARGAGCG